MSEKTVDHYRSQASSILFTRGWTLGLGLAGFTVAIAVVLAVIDLRAGQGETAPPTWGTITPITVTVTVTVVLLLAAYLFFRDKLWLEALWAACADIAVSETAAVSRDTQIQTMETEAKGSTEKIEGLQDEAQRISAEHAQKLGELQRELDAARGHVTTANAATFADESASA